LDGVYDVVEAGFYACYYVNHEAPLGVAAPIVSGLCLAADSGVDVLHGTPVRDAGYEGSVCPDPIERVLNALGIQCPVTYLPGIHDDGSVDWP
jgi:hypothetical protein